MRRHRALALFSIIGGLLLALSGPGLGSPSVAFGSTPQEAGYADFSHAGADLPSSDKPQSKLWFNDGRWWASMYNLTSHSYRIYWLDLTTQDWIPTTTDLDTRAQTMTDILWDNTAKKLYLVSGGTGTDAWFMRYSYNPATKLYARDFAPVVVRSGGGETIVLDKDSTGQLWVTYTQGQKVYVNRSTTSDSVWGPPFVIPGPISATSVFGDDISSVVAYRDASGNSIGVLWSNHDAAHPGISSMHFAYHRDNDADNVWQPIESIYSSMCAADDHINIKSLQADTSGTLFAAVKTSFADSGCNGGSNPVQVNLVVRKPNNTWKVVPYGYKADDHTRPVVLLDTTNRKVYVFATSKTTCGPTAIYMKSTSMDNPDFSKQPGKGTPFIKSSTYTCINNPTSTKQTVDASTGIVILASDKLQNFYLHNYLDLGSQTFPRLIVQTNPQGAQANAPFATQPVVVAQSAPNVTLTSFNGPVTLAIKSGTGTAGAVLGGTVTVNAVNGVASFSGLSINKAGNGYRLTATSSGVTSVDSAVFDITKTEQTITFDALGSKQYGDQPFTVSATSSSGLAVAFTASGDCTIASRTITITAAGSCTVTANQAGDTTFNPAPALAQPFTILKANQTINFGTLPNKRFGDPPFTISASASSGLPVAFTASGSCTLSGSTVTLTGASGYSIKASQAGNANYNPAADV
ncbi:MAG: hypothetical protein ABIV47_26525, partial [Roseiflexaceae bacterium]